MGDAKCGDFVVALDAGEGTRIGYPYRVMALFMCSNGVTVELEDGSGAGLYRHEYILLKPEQNETP